MSLEVIRIEPDWVSIVRALMSQGKTEEDIAKICDVNIHTTRLLQEEVHEQDRKNAPAKDEEQRHLCLV